MGCLGPSSGTCHVNATPAAILARAWLLDSLECHPHHGIIEPIWGLPNAFTSLLSHQPEKAIMSASVGPLFHAPISHPSCSTAILPICISTRRQLSSDSPDTCIINLRTTPSRLSSLASDLCPVQRNPDVRGSRHKATAISFSPNLHRLVNPR